jgi:hypothetical protein
MSCRLFLVFFSSALQRLPSAAEPLTPPLAFRVGPQAGPGSGRGPGPGPVLLGTCPSCRGSIRSVGAWRCGPGRALDPALILGFRRYCQAGGRLRGLPTSGYRASPALSAPFRVAVLPCLLGPVCLLSRRCRAATPLPPSPEPDGLGCTALKQTHASLGALRRRVAQLRWASALHFAPSSVLPRTGSGLSASSPAGAAGSE